MSQMKKTVVITGASSGIGFSSVRRMSEAGWRVFATVRKHADMDKFRASGFGDVFPVMMDVEAPSSITAAAEQVKSQLGQCGLDALVNVAGIGLARPLEYASADEIREIFEINVFGQVAVTQAFFPLLRKNRGRIVNVTSVGAHIAIPFGGLLNASKSAFGIISDTLRMELRPFGMHVSTVEPGAISTPAVEKTLGDADSVINNLPAHGRAQYGSMFKTFAQRAYLREKNGSSPDLVAETIHQALTCGSPRTRYRVGKHAKLLATIARILPDRLLDAIRLRILGLPAQFGALKA
jgi:NAD(P)-dependent dehydrogenase (short-subunit alcohol dehydrogenase family)